LKFRFGRVLLLAVMILSLTALKPHQIFEYKDSKYTASHTFEVPCSPDQVLADLFDFNQHRLYTKGPDNITLLDKGNQWYKIRYEFSLIGFDASSVYRRTLRDNCIHYELITLSELSFFIPPISTIEGHICVEPVKTGSRVIITEWGQFATEPGPLDRQVARVLLQGILRNITDYANQCAERTAQRHGEALGAIGDN